MFFNFILSHKHFLCPLTVFGRYILKGYVMSHAEVGQRNVKSGMSAITLRNVRGGSGPTFSELTSIF